tara:strand:- start:2021 stop:2239 length:219 start_codon:yes stop_codon:yes gene_type:complete
MSKNQFKIIKPTEEPPKELEKEVMGSVKTTVLILRIVQLFVGDIEGTILSLFKTNPKESISKKDIDDHKKKL